MCRPSYSHTGHASGNARQQWVGGAGILKWGVDANVQQGFLTLQRIAGRTRAISFDIFKIAFICIRIVPRESIEKPLFRGPRFSTWAFVARTEARSRISLQRTPGDPLVICWLTSPLDLMWPTSRSLPRRWEVKYGQQPSATEKCCHHLYET